MPITESRNFFQGGGGGRRRPRQRKNFMQMFGGGNDEQAESNARSWLQRAKFDTLNSRLADIAAGGLSRYQEFATRPEEISLSQRDAIVRDAMTGMNRLIEGYTFATPEEREVAEEFVNRYQADLTSKLSLYESTLRRQGDIKQENEQERDEEYAQERAARKVEQRELWVQRTRFEGLERRVSGLASEAINQFETGVSDSGDINSDYRKNVLSEFDKKAKAFKSGYKFEDEAERKVIDEVIAMKRNAIVTDINNFERSLRANERERKARKDVALAESSEKWVQDTKYKNTVAVIGSSADSKLTSYKELVVGPERISDAKRNALLQRFDKEMEEKRKGTTFESAAHKEVFDLEVDRMRSDLERSMLAHDSAIRRQERTEQRRDSINEMKGALDDIDRQRLADQAEQEQLARIRQSGEIETRISTAFNESVKSIRGMSEEWQDGDHLLPPDLSSALEPFIALRESLVSAKDTYDPVVFESKLAALDSRIAQAEGQLAEEENRLNRQFINEDADRKFSGVLDNASSPKDFRLLRKEIPNYVRMKSGVNNTEEQTRYEGIIQKRIDEAAVLEFRNDPVGFDLAEWSSIVSGDVEKRIATGIDDEIVKFAERSFSGLDAKLTRAEMNSDSFESIAATKLDGIKKVREAWQSNAVKRRYRPEEIQERMDALDLAANQIDTEVGSFVELRGRLLRPEMEHVGPLTKQEQTWANSIIQDQLSKSPSPARAADILVRTRGYDMPAVKQYLETQAYSGLAVSPGEEGATPKGIEALYGIVQYIGAKNANMLYDQLPESVRGQVDDYVRARRLTEWTPAEAWDHITARDRDADREARISAMNTDYNRTSAAGRAKFNELVFNSLEEKYSGLEQEYVEGDVSDTVRLFAEQHISRWGGSVEDAVAWGVQQLERKGYGFNPHTERLEANYHGTILAKPGDKPESTIKRINYAWARRGVFTVDESKIRAARGEEATVQQKPFSDKTHVAFKTVIDGKEALGFMIRPDRGAPSEFVLDKDGKMLAIPIDDLKEEYDGWRRSVLTMRDGRAGFPGLTRIEEEASRLSSDIYRENVSWRAPFKAESEESKKLRARREKLRERAASMRRVLDLKTRFIPDGNVELMNMFDWREQ